MILYIICLYPFIIHGYLVYFPVLVIVNNAAMNIGVQISLWDSDIISFIYISVGMCVCVSIYIHTHTEGVFLDHMVVLFLIFWGTFILFSIVAVPIYILTRVYKSSFSPHSHQHSSHFSPHLHQYSSHLVFLMVAIWWCEVIACCGFGLQFPND